MRGIRKTLDPEGDLRRAENAMKVSGTVAARQKYADELVRLGRAAEALPIYQNCLTGVFADDPKLLLGYAQAQFAAGDATAARNTLDDLIRRNPGLQVTGRPPAVRAGARRRREPRKGVVRVRDAGRVLPGRRGRRALREAVEAPGQGPLAQQTLEALLERANYAPAHYRKAQREWLDEAASELRRLTPDQLLRLMERNDTPSIMAL